MKNPLCFRMKVAQGLSLGETVSSRIKCIFFCLCTKLLLAVPTSHEDYEASSGFLDPSVDYASTYGRISDVDDERGIIKVKVSSDYTRFLLPQDQVTLRVLKLGKSYCSARTLVAEIGYVSVQLEDKSCMPKKYILRGWSVHVESSIMSLRVQQASSYRKELLERKQAYLSQLSQVNQYFYKFDQQADPELAKIDAEIAALAARRVEYLNQLKSGQADKAVGQTELKRELYNLDELLEFYRIDRKDQLSDSSLADYDKSAPVNKPARRQ
jgi:hypothetical protein